MNREELKTMIGGCIATLPTPMDDDFNLDLARMTEVTQWWVEQGLGTGTSPLKTSAAMGEGPDLGDGRVAAPSAHRRKSRQPRHQGHMRSQAEEHPAHHR